MVGTKLVQEATAVHVCHAIQGLELSPAQSIIARIIPATKFWFEARGQTGGAAACRVAPVGLRPQAFYPEADRFAMRIQRCEGHHYVIVDVSRATLTDPKRYLFQRCSDGGLVHHQQFQCVGSNGRVLVHV